MIDAYGRNILVLAAAGGLVAWTARGEIAIRCDYPGGNVKVVAVDEASGKVTVAPDLRDTQGYWFHFDFTVTGAAAALRLSAKRAGVSLLARPGRQP